MQKKGTSLFTAVDRSGPLAAFTKLISLEFAEEVSILGFYSTWKQTILTLLLNWVLFLNFLLLGDRLDLFLEMGKGHNLECITSLYNQQYWLFSECILTTTQSVFLKNMQTLFLEDQAFLAVSLHWIAYFVYLTFFTHSCLKSEAVGIVSWESSRNGANEGDIQFVPRDLFSPK